MKEFLKINANELKVVTTEIKEEAYQYEVLEAKKFAIETEMELSAQRYNDKIELLQKELDVIDELLKEAKKLNICKKPEEFKEVEEILKN